MYTSTTLVNVADESNKQQKLQNTPEFNAREMIAPTMMTARQSCASRLESEQTNIIGRKNPGNNERKPMAMPNGTIEEAKVELTEVSTEVPNGPIKSSPEVTDKSIKNFYIDVAEVKSNPAATSSREMRSTNIVAYSHESITKKVMVPGVTRFESIIWIAVEICGLIFSGLPVISVPFGILFKKEQYMWDKWDKPVRVFFLVLNLIMSSLIFLDGIVKSKDLLAHYHKEKQAGVALMVCSVMAVIMYWLTNKNFAWVFLFCSFVTWFVVLARDAFKIPSPK